VFAVTELFRLAKQAGPLTDAQKSYYMSLMQKARTIDDRFGGDESKYIAYLADQQAKISAWQARDLDSRSCSSPSRLPEDWTLPDPLAASVKASPPKQPTPKGKSPRAVTGMSPRAL
jgi:hypothetical protein